jgi:hypothetical protein
MDSPPTPLHGNHLTRLNSLDDRVLDRFIERFAESFSSVQATAVVEFRDAVDRFSNASSDLEAIVSV